MGGMVSGIIRASNPPTVGFFYRFFTPLLMRSPCPLIMLLLNSFLQ
jgi:hypothetical protein